MIWKSCWFSSLCQILGGIASRIAARHMSCKYGQWRVISTPCLHHCEAQESEGRACPAISVPGEYPGHAISYVALGSSENGLTFLTSVIYRLMPPSIVHTAIHS